MKRLLWLLKRVGRRGAFLLFLAVLFVNGALSFQNQDTKLLRQVYPLFEYVPPVVWAFSWVATAVFCAVAAMWSRFELLAFSLAQLMFTSWAGNYFWAWIEGSPLPRPWSGMLIYLAFAGTIMLVAGWRENTPGIRKFHGEAR